jgi:amino-acid N-acetyltransferase
MTPVALPVLDVPGAAWPSCEVPACAAPARGTSSRVPARPRHLVLVRADEPVALRRAQATDTAAVHALLERFVGNGGLLPRTQEQVAGMMDGFVVALRGGRIVGCGALRRYSPGLAEVVALAVAEEMHGTGIGRRVVESLVEQARAAGVVRLFALTTQAGFFQRLGFEATTTAEFPQKVAADCSTCARRHACVEVAVALSL